MGKMHPTRSLPKSLRVWLALPIVVAALAACAPTAPVQIPSTWQPPPHKPAPSAARRQAPAPAPQEILKPAPNISEQNITPQTTAPKAGSAGQSSTNQPPATPQQLASMQLVDQAEAALAQGHPNQAINTLEQAIQVDVYNGQAFYDLARAWQSKGSQANALEFANKAEILFQNNPAKLKQVYLLKAELYQESGDIANAQAYRQKAARF